MSEHYHFTRDELTRSIKVDYAKGKVYRAGSALGIEAGFVEVVDMKTGESEVVPANASGTRPRDEAGDRSSPFVVL